MANGFGQGGGGGEGFGFVVIAIGGWLALVTDAIGDVSICHGDVAIAAAGAVGLGGVLTRRGAVLESHCCEEPAEYWTSRDLVRPGNIVVHIVKATTGLIGGKPI